MKRPILYTNPVTFFLLLVCICSCVPNRKIVYLQNGDVNQSDLPQDTVLRKYEVERFDYKLQPNDLLSVTFESLTPSDYNFFVSKNTQNTGIYNNAGTGPLVAGELVDEEGRISFPVIGKFKVAGLTVFEVQDTLQALADQYLESPVVKVRLLNYRITVLGEVTNQGTVTLTNNRVTMLEAIGLSGGLSELADRSSVKLIRQKGGKTDVVYLNLLEEDFIHSPYYYVYQNDVLIVPALKQRPFRRYFGENLALVVSTLSLLVLTLNLIQQ